MPYHAPGVLGKYDPEKLEVAVDLIDIDPELIDYYRNTDHVPIDKSKRNQPVVLQRLSNGRFRLVGGARRFLFHKNHGVATIASHIVPPTMNESDIRQLHFCDAIKFENLNHVECAFGLQKYFSPVEDDRLVARKLGRQVQSVQVWRSMPHLNPRVLELINQGDEWSTPITDLDILCGLRGPRSHKRQLRALKRLRSQYNPQAGTKRPFKSRGQIESMIAELVSKGVDPLVSMALSWTLDCVGDDEFRDAYRKELHRLRNGRNNT